MTIGSRGPTGQDQAALAEALQHHQAGRFAEAEAVYRQVLELQPRNGEALNLLGVLYAQHGRFDPARELLESAVREQPNNPQFQANFARIMLGAGDQAAAIEAYQKAVDLDPRNLAARIDLGNLLISVDRLADAEACLRQAIELDPNLADAYEGLGFALVRGHRADEAMAAFERAVALNPNSPGAQANLGGLLLDKGRAREAVACFQRALALTPNSAELQTNLGIALFAAGEPEAALQACDAALRLDPNNARALGAKGIALADLGRDAQAAQIFDYDGLLGFKRWTAVPGYSSLETFNRDLADTVCRDPSLMADRPGRTTRLGSQTGNLMINPVGVVAAFESMIREAVEGYFSAEAITAHPYGPRQPADWRLVSWATILDSSGHQDPHNHPSGVLSGVYYAQLPAVIQADDQTQQGYLEFGRPNKDISDKEPTRLKTICPEEGLCVMFPSHFWHRTIPYVSEENRISLAFDVVPKG